MKILITGGTGLIGRHFIKAFQQPYQFTVLTRNRHKAKLYLPEGVEFIEQLPEQNCYEAIINLAGEAIVDRRWTETQMPSEISAVGKSKPDCKISADA